MTTSTALARTLLTALLGLSAIPAGAQLNREAMAPREVNKSTKWGITIGQERLAGENHYATAVAVSQKLYANQAAYHVMIASGEDFPDAITALNHSKKGQPTPILLATKTGLTPAVEAELKRIATSNAVVSLIGGEQALSNDVERQLIHLGYNVRRIAGANRADTALKLADISTSRKGTVAVVSAADDFATSIVAAAYADRIDAPHLITFTDDLNSQFKAEDWLQTNGITSVYAFGKETANHFSLPVTTITGTDNQEVWVDQAVCYPKDDCVTIAALAPPAMPGQQVAEYIWQHHFKAASNFVVINGERPVDGIAAGQLAVALDAPILTTFSTGGDPNYVGGNQPVNFRYPNLMKREDPRDRSFYFVGGTDALSEETRKTIVDLLD